MFLLAISGILCVLGWLNWNGSLSLIWHNSELINIQHVKGFAYKAQISEEIQSGQNAPLYLLENGVVIPYQPCVDQSDSLISEIEEKGMGRSVILSNNSILFSSSDGKNPISENHKYTLLISDKIPFLILISLSGFILLLLIILGIIRLSTNSKKNKIKVNFLRKKLLVVCVWVCTFLFCLFIIPDDQFLRGFFYVKPGLGIFRFILQRTPFYLIIAAICTVILYWLKEKSIFHKVLIAIVVLTGMFYYFFPAWNYYGIKDTTSDYFPVYTVNSIQMPGYSRLIEDAMTVRKAEDLAWWRSEEGISHLKEMSGKTYVDRSGNSRGLIEIVHLQKILLIICLIAAMILISQIISPYFTAYLFEFLITLKILAVEANNIAPDSLMEGLSLFCLGLFAFFAVSRMKWIFPFFCFFAACAVLMDIQMLYLLLPLLVFGIMLCIMYHWAAFPSLLTGLIIFVWFISIPARSIYDNYQEIVWFPGAGYQKMAQAVPLIDEEDVLSAKNDEDQNFLKKCVEKAEKIDKAQVLSNQNQYLYNAALSSAEEEGYDHVRASILFERTAPGILMNHISELRNQIPTRTEMILKMFQPPIEKIAIYCILGLILALVWIRCSEISLAGFLFFITGLIELSENYIFQPDNRMIILGEEILAISFVMVLFNLLRKKKQKS